MNNKFREAQDVLKHPGGMASAGFNRKVHGDTYNECFRYQNERTDPDLHGGWNLAEKMIEEGELFYVHNFHSIDCPEGYAFQYGGSFVCNACNKDHLEKEWWKIRIFKDGDAWCCIGLDFQNLQESDNYAFGDTRAEAINNYGNIYAPLPAPPEERNVNMEWISIQNNGLPDFRVFGFHTGRKVKFKAGDGDHEGLYHGYGGFQADDSEDRSLSNLYDAGFEGDKQVTHWSYCEPPEDK